MPETALNALFTIVTLGGLWVLLCWLLKGLFVDEFRQRLFELRDELWEGATDGPLAFDVRSYGMLRSMLNGGIRFADRLNLVTVVGFFAIRRAKPVGAYRSFQIAWAEARDELSPEGQELVDKIRTDLHVLVFKYSLLGSPLLWPLAISFFVLAVCAVIGTGTSIGLVKVAKQVFVKYSEQAKYLDPTAHEIGRARGMAKAA